MEKRLENLSKTTQQMYLREIQRLQEDTECNIKDVEYVKKKSESFTKGRKMTLYKAMCYYDTNNIDYYRERIKELVESEHEEYNVVLSEDEKVLLEYFERVMNVQEINREKYIKIWEKLDNKSMEKSLLMLHLFHPLRSDYYTLKYKRADDNIDMENDNYYDMSSGQIVLNTTVKISRKLNIQLDNCHKEILDDYVKTLSPIDNVVFKWGCSNSYAKALSRISLRVFGEKMTINSYRHLNDFPEGIKEMIKRLNEKAIKMNHTLMTHALKY
jgi:hypothetical protein